MNWGLDNLAVNLHGTGMRTIFASTGMAHMKVRVLQDVSNNLRQALFEDSGTSAASKFYLVISNKDPLIRTSFGKRFCIKLI